MVGAILSRRGAAGYAAEVTPTAAAGAKTTAAGKAGQTSALSKCTHGAAQAGKAQYPRAGRSDT